MTSKEILLKAADLVDKGWCQHAFARDARGQNCGIDAAVRLCPRGAIHKVSLWVDPSNWKDPRLLPAVTLAHSALHALISSKLNASGVHVSQRLDPIAYWNDTIATSGAEVAGVMREVAELVACP